MNSRLDGGPGEPGLRAVSVDNYGGAREMVRHLVDAGHRTIAFIAGPGDNFDATERLRGSRDQLAASLPDARPWVLQGDFDERSEERRVGKEWVSTGRSRGAPYQKKTKKKQQKTDT